MADKNEIYKDRRDVQAQINAGLKDQNNLTNAFSKLLQEQLNTSEELTKSVKDRAKTLNIMIQAGNKDLSLDTRLTKLKSRQAEIDEKLSKSRGKSGRFQKGFNAQVVKSLKLDKESLDTQIKELSIKKGVKDLTEGASNAFKKQIVQGGLLVGLFMGLKKLAFAFAAQVDTLGKSFGVAGAETGNLQDTLLQSSVEMTKFGLGLGDAISMTNTLSSQFGFGVLESAKMSKNIASSAVGMGLSADEGANLFGALMSIGNLTFKQSKDLAQSAYHLAEANDVAPQAVMKDIAANSDFFAKHMKDGGKNVLEAAVQAKKLGLGLSAIEGIAGGLLDFQSSLNAEIEASVMIGRQLNFQKARELALNDDLTGMMDEVLKQLGGEHEFNKMNRLQREAIAKSIGVTVTDMAKLVGEHGKLESQKSFAEIAGPDAISNLTAIINKVKSIGAELLNTVGPVIEETVGKFGKWVENSENIEKMKEFVVGLADGLANLPGIIKTVIGVMLIWKTVSLAVAAANAAAMVFGAGAATLGVGTAVALAGALGVWATLSALPSFQTLPSGMGADLQGATLVHPQGSFGKETVLHTEEITDEIKLLRDEMRSYFGFGGSALKGIGQSVAGGIESVAK
jgi:hypothetical protein